MANNSLGIQLQIGFDTKQAEQALKNVVKTLQQNVKLTLDIDIGQIKQIESKLSDALKQVQQTMAKNQITPQIDTQKFVGELNNIANITKRTFKSVNGELRAVVTEFQSYIGQIQKIYQDMKTKNVTQIDVFDYKQLEKAEIALEKMKTKLISSLDSIVNRARGFADKNVYNALLQEIKEFKLPSSFEEVERWLLDITGRVNEFKNVSFQKMFDTKQIEKIIGTVQKLGNRLESLRDNYNSILELIGEKGRITTLTKQIDSLLFLKDRPQKYLEIYNEIITSMSRIEHEATITQNAYQQLLSVTSWYKKFSSNLNLFTAAFGENIKKAGVEEQIQRIKQQAIDLMKSVGSVFNNIRHNKIFPDESIEVFNQRIRNMKNNIMTTFDTIKAKVRGTMVDLTNRQTTLQKAFETAFTKFGIWMTATTGFYTLVRQFQQGFQLITDLNKAMTEISIVTGMNQEQVMNLAKSYNQLAQQLGVTTREIASSAVEFYRQGLSNEQVMQRMITTTQYAKISALDFRDASQILTATVNSMGVSIQRASDVFAYLGDATATGADEIGIAFQKVGGSAAALDVEFEKVASWIAVISARTRESAESIGNAIKSIMARYQQLKEKGYTEEDSVSVNQVAKALREVGISIVDAQGNFRNFGEVMDELGAKWNTLTNRQKAYIATTLAGTYQQSRFYNLMEGYAESVTLYNQALNAAGTTQRKYQLYLQSTEAQLNKLQASWEAFWLTTIKSESLNNVLRVLNNLMGGLSGIARHVGGLNTILAILGGALGLIYRNLRVVNIAFSEGKFQAQLFGKEIATLSAGLKNLSVSFSVANIKTAIGNFVGNLAATIGSVLINVGIGMLVGLIVNKVFELIDNVIHRAERAREQFNDMVDTFNQKMTTSNDNIVFLSSIQSEYEQLANKTNRTNEEQQRFNQLTNEIAQRMPELISGYDEYGNAILKVGNNLGVVIEQLRESQKVEAQNFLKSFSKGMQDVVMPQIREYQRDIEQFKGAIAFLQDELNRVRPEYRGGIQNQIKDWQKMLDETHQKMNDVYKNYLQQYVRAILTLNDAYQKLNATQKQMVSISIENFLNTGDVTRIKNVEDFVKVINNIVQSVSKVDVDKVKQQFEQLQQQFMENGDIQKYRDSVEALYKSLSKLTGIPVDVLKRIFNFDILPKDMQDMASRMQELSSEYVTMLETINDKYSRVQSAIEEYNSSGRITLDTVLKLAKSGYPELLKMVGNQKELYQALTKISNELIDTELDGFQKKVRALDLWTKAQLQSLGIIASAVELYTLYQKTGSLESALKILSASGQAKINWGNLNELRSLMGKIQKEGYLEYGKGLYEYYQEIGTLRKNKSWATPKGSSSTKSKSTFDIDVDDYKLREYQNQFNNVKDTISAAKDKVEEFLDAHDFTNAEKAVKNLDKAYANALKTMDNIIKNTKSLANSIGRQFEKQFGIKIFDKKQSDVMAEIAKRFKNDSEKGSKAREMAENYFSTLGTVEDMQKERSALAQEHVKVMSQYNKSIKQGRVSDKLELFDQDIERKNFALDMMDAKIEEVSYKEATNTAKIIKLYKDKNNVLQNNVKWLKDSIKMLQEEEKKTTDQEAKKNIQDSIQKGQKQLADWQQKIYETNEKIADLYIQSSNQAVESFNKNIDEAKDRINDLEYTDINNVNARIEAYDNYINFLKQQNAEIDNQIAKLQQAAQQFDKNSQSYNDIMTQIDNLNKIKQNNLNEIMQSEANKVNSVVNIYKDYLDSLEENISNHENLLSALESESQHYEEKIDLIDKIIAKYNNEKQNIIALQQVVKSLMLQYSPNSIEYKTLSQFLDTLNDKLLEIDKNIVSLGQKKIRLQIDIIANKYDLDNLSRQIDDLQRKIQVLNNLGVIGGSQVLQVENELINALHRRRIALQELIQTAQQGLAEAQTQAEADQWNEILQNYVSDFWSVSEQLSSIFGQYMQKVMNTIKKQYDTEMQDTIDKYDNELKVKIDEFDAKIKALQDELRALQDDTADKQQQLVAMEAELQLWRRDDSQLAKGKVLELEKRIAETRKELRIKDLQKQIDYYEEQKKQTQDYYNNLKEQTRKTYERLMNDINIYQKTIEMITQNNMNDIINLLKKYDPEFQALANIFGKSFENAFVTVFTNIRREIQDLQNMINSLKLSYNIGSYSSSYSGYSSNSYDNLISSGYYSFYDNYTQQSQYYQNQWDLLRQSYSTRQKELDQQLLDAKYTWMVASQKDDQASKEYATYYGQLARSLGATIDPYNQLNFQQALEEYKKKYGEDYIPQWIGYAQGTKYSVGGYAIVGEEGAELVRLPLGSEVIPNGKLTEFINSIIPALKNLNVLSKTSPLSSIVNKVANIYNQYEVKAYTPFDIKNMADDVGRMIHIQLKKAGIAVNAI